MKFQDMLSPMAPDGDFEVLEGEVLPAGHGVNGDIFPQSAARRRANLPKPAPVPVEGDLFTGGTLRSDAETARLDRELDEQVPPFSGPLVPRMPERSTQPTASQTTRRARREVYELPNQNRPQAQDRKPTLTQRQRIERDITDADRQSAAAGFEELRAMWPKLREHRP